MKNHCHSSRSNTCLYWPPPLMPAQEESSLRAPTSRLTLRNRRRFLPVLSLLPLFHKAEQPWEWQRSSSRGKVTISDLFKRYCFRLSADNTALPLLLSDLFLRPCVSRIILLNNSYNPKLKATALGHTVIVILHFLTSPFLFSNHLEKLCQFKICIKPDYDK